MLRKMSLIFSFFLLALCNCVYAVQVLDVKVDVDLGANEAYSGIIGLQNPTDEEMAVRIYFEDFAYVAPYDGTKKFYPHNSLDGSAARIVDFSPKELTLAPMENRNINYTINTPKDFDSLYHGVLFFEISLGGSFDNTGKAVELLSRTGSLFFIQPGVEKERMAIENVRFEEKAIKADIKNTSKRFLNTKADYYILDELGTPIARDSTEVKYLLPGDSYELGIAVPEDISDGNYFMILTYNLKDSDVFVTEIDFSVSSSGVKILEVRQD